MRFGFVTSFGIFLQTIVKTEHENGFFTPKEGENAAERFSLVLNRMKMPACPNESPREHPPVGTDVDSAASVSS